MIFRPTYDLTYLLSYLRGKTDVTNIRLRHENAFSNPNNDVLEERFDKLLEILSVSAGPQHRLIVLNGRLHLVLVLGLVQLKHTRWRRSHFGWHKLHQMALFGLAELQQSHG